MFKHRVKNIPIFTQIRIFKVDFFDCFYSLFYDIIVIINCKEKKN